MTKNNLQPQNSKNPETLVYSHQVEQQLRVNHVGLRQQQAELEQNAALMAKQKEMEKQNIEKIMRFKKQEEEREQRRLAEERQRMAQEREKEERSNGEQGVFHLPQISSLSTAGDPPATYSVNQEFLSSLSKNLGANDAMANLLGPGPPSQPGSNVASAGIPLLQPPPQSGRAARTSPSARTGNSTVNRVSPRQGQAISRPTSREAEPLYARVNKRSPEKNPTAHVRPFQQAERERTSGTSGGPSSRTGIGDVMGASQGWRPLQVGRGAQGVGGQQDLRGNQGAPSQPDLLAGQRNQLGRYSQDQSGRVHNAMEINKIAQCSKLVPAMSGSEIRAALEAVNWDTSVAVKNLKIDKLYRIGVATKPKCEKVLQAVNWDLEQAASKLLDSL